MSLQVAKRDLATQTAYDELTRIQRGHYPEHGRWKEYYRLVVACLRRFLAQRYNVQTADPSIGAMRHALHHSSITPDLAHSLLDLMAENETVQKATFLPGLSQGRQLTERARAFITQTALPSAE